jgi:hypothetical protein
MQIYNLAALHGFPKEMFSGEWRRLCFVLTSRAELHKSSLQNIERLIWFLLSKAQP